MIIFFMLDLYLYFITRIYSIFEICLFYNKLIPSFCINIGLLAEGNCRTCLIELEKLNKPQVSCCLNILSNSKIYTKTPFLLKIRENIFEFIMLNHSLCCPICDQGSDCDLQEEIQLFSSLKYRYIFPKRSKRNKYFLKYIKTYMNRCIICTRCDRLFNIIFNKKKLGTINRGMETEISFFTNNNISLNTFVSNVADICPVGLITLIKY